MNSDVYLSEFVVKKEGLELQNKSKTTGPKRLFLRFPLKFLNVCALDFWQKDASFHPWILKRIASAAHLSKNQGSGFWPPKGFFA